MCFLGLEPCSAGWTAILRFAAEGALLFTRARPELYACACRTATLTIPPLHGSPVVTALGLVGLAVGLGSTDGRSLLFLTALLRASCFHPTLQRLGCWLLTLYVQYVRPYVLACGSNQVCVKLRRPGFQDGSVLPSCGLLVCVSAGVPKKATPLHLKGRPVRFDTVALALALALLYGVAGLGRLSAGKSLTRHVIVMIGIVGACRWLAPSDRRDCRAKCAYLLPLLADRILRHGAPLHDASDRKDACTGKGAVLPPEVLPTYAKTDVGKPGQELNDG